MTDPQGELSQVNPGALHADVITQKNEVALWTECRYDFGQQILQRREVAMNVSQLRPWP